MIEIYNDSEWSVEYYTIKPADTALPLVRVNTKEEALAELERVRGLSKWPDSINVFRYLSRVAYGQKRVIMLGGI